MSRRPGRRQAGVAILEFALSFSLFWVVFMAVVEFSRLMLAWNTATEATRLAVRLASICDQGNAQENLIRQKVAYFIEASGQVTLGSSSDWLRINYYEANCTSSTCLYVEAELQDIHPNMMIPFLSPVITLPSNRIRVTRESMQNVIATETNNVCN